MIASFSRALLEGLTDEQTDDEFNATLEASVAQIYDASVHKAVSALSCHNIDYRLTVFAELVASPHGRSPLRRRQHLCEDARQYHAPT
jgi:hypothetical protein